MRSFVLLASLLLAARAEAAETWTYASSEHFEVYTTGGAGTARQSLSYFERIQAFFAQQLNLRPLQTVPTRLIIFSNDKQFAPYRPSATAAAFYQAGVDRDYIVMGRFDEESNDIVAHEYMHLIIRYSKARFPVWLNEGLAEFFSTIAPEGNKMTVGKVPEGRLLYLRSGVALIDIRRLFAVGHDSPEYNTRTHAGVFYSESWALTHMLELDGRYRGGMDAFLKAMASGMNAVDALMKVYGKTPETVFGDLVNYIQQSQYLYGAVAYTVPPDTKYQTKVVDPFDAELVTANLLANSPTGENAARAAYARLEAQKPNDVAMLEARAYFELYRGKRTDALPYFERAVAQGSRNVKLMMDYASFDPAKSDALIDKALAVAPDDPDVRIEHARRLLRDRKPGQAVVAFQNIGELDRQQTFEMYQILANAYMQVNQPADAREAARRMAQAAEDGPQAEFAVRLAKSIDDSVAQRSAFEQRVRDADAALLSPPADGGSAFQPPLLTVLPSSQTPLVNVAGRLRNVACRNGETVLELLVGDQTVRLFIDDGKAIDVQGVPGNQVELKCGPLDQKLTIGYKPGVDPTRKTVGYVRLLDYR